MRVVKVSLVLTSFALAAWLIRSRLSPERPGNVVKLVYRPVTRWAAQRALAGRNRSQTKPEAGRFTRAEVNHLVEQAWLKYDELTVVLSYEPTAGSRMNVRLACLTLAFFHILLAAGVERGYAIELIGDMTWSVYRQWAVVGRFLARLQPFLSVLKWRGPDDIVVPSSRHASGDDSLMPLLFPFNSPGYIARRIATDDGIAFDMTHCPVAQYFRAYGAADLCAGSWCNLDYGLAEMYGRKLVRTKTLAAGDACCDFRFVGTGEPLPFIGVDATHKQSAARPAQRAPRTRAAHRPKPEPGASADTDEAHVDVGDRVAPSITSPSAIERPTCYGRYNVLAYSVFIAASPDAVFRVIADPRSKLAWVPAIRRVEMSQATVPIGIPPGAAGPPGLGTNYLASSGVGPLEFVFQEQIVEWVENERVAYEGHSPWGYFKTVVVLHPENEGTRVHYRMDYRFPGGWAGAGLGRMLARLFRKPVEARTAARLKTVVEHGLWGTTS